MSKHLYGLYDTQEGEICLGIFENVPELAKYIGLKEQSVRGAMSMYGGMLKKRYRVEKINKEE